jgi:cell division protein FtsN
MLFGFGLGLAAAFGLYLGAGTDGDAPLARARVAPPAAVPEGPGPGVSGADVPAEARAEAQHAAPPSPASRFDFYEMLPAFEVVIPEIETAARPASPMTAVEEPGLYVLQVGSFTALGDADRRQASLALLGIESNIQRVTIDDAVFHRVRVGPMSELDRLNVVRRQLRDARIDSLLMRVPQ